ncbi:MAG: short-chain dehydrogenase, partial [Bacillus cereus]|nr:short-chain dehydrogenase [Bacillus cereus]
IFYEAVTSSMFFKNSDELNEIPSKIVQATAEQKYMIHYGVYM